MDGHVLYYAIGLVMGIAMGTALGTALAKEQGRPGLLPLVLAFAVPAGVLLGYALDTFAGFVSASAIR